MLADLSILDPRGPQDRQPIWDQSVIIEESMALYPDASAADQSVQDVKP
jgi:hypothetical protein